MISFYEKYKKKFYSQWGEEGTILEILKRLDITVENKWLCEFGAWDGIKFSNTYYFVENYDCNAIYIEGDKDRFRELLETSKKTISGKIIPVNKFVKNDLDLILENNGVPKDFLILSIDVDGMDYHIWKNMVIYKPIIVIIEIGSGIPPPVEYIYGEKNKTNLKLENTTFQSMLNLAISKNYSFVCHTGNMIFVRNDYFNKLNLNYKNPFENFCRRHVKSKQNKLLLKKAIDLYK